MVLKEFLYLINTGNIIIAKKPDNFLKEKYIPFPQYEIIAKKSFNKPLTPDERMSGAQYKDMNIDPLDLITEIGEIKLYNTWNERWLLIVLDNYTNHDQFHTVTLKDFASKVTMDFNRAFFSGVFVYFHPYEDVWMSYDSKKFKEVEDYKVIGIYFRSEGIIQLEIMDNYK